MPRILSCDGKLSPKIVLVLATENFTQYVGVMLLADVTDDFAFF